MPLGDASQDEGRRGGGPDQVAKEGATQEVPADLFSLQEQEVLHPFSLVLFGARRRGGRGG